MRSRFLLGALVVLGWAWPAPAAAPPAPPGLSVSADGVLTLAGKPFRGIGVNYFDAFGRTLARADDTSYDAGFKTLAEHRIPFVRFAGCGFWPADMKLYREDRAAYFRRLDGVVRSAERHGIGLIPSLFWFMSTVPDLAGEPCDQWGNPQSKTHEFMRTYVREVVTRYKDSPAVWGWEFGNEFDLRADLPNAAAQRPPVGPRQDMPAARSERDDLTYAMVRTAVAAFAQEVRRYDPHRIITSGHWIPRLSAWHQMKEKSWTKDTPDQFAEMLLGDHPDPINVLSVHVYGENVLRLPLAAETAARARKPLFVGEFGVEGDPSPDVEKRFAAMLRAVEQSGVPLAALWVYDFARQKEYSVTAENPRAWQLRAIAEANRRLGTGRENFLGSPRP